jgi:polysaccharide export outer membrane protein
MHLLPVPSRPVFDRNPLATSSCQHRALLGLGLVLALLALAGCSALPSSGPLVNDVVAPAGAASAPVLVVDVDAAVARRLEQRRRSAGFADSLGSSPAEEHPLAPGDVVETTIWEAPPATLFSGGLTEGRIALSSSRAVTVPEQVVGVDGTLTVPFAGRVPAAGLRLAAVEAEIVRRLTGKANQPEVMLRRVRSSSLAVTVVGEVQNAARVPITAGGERLLDVLATVGGVRQPVNKITVQVTRGGQVQAMPLDTVIREPRHNVTLRPGDVVTALHQPLSFTALGATGRNEEVPFEAQGISLAQALARAGGLVDSRSDAQGVFIFRYENPEALDGPRRPAGAAPDGKVPVVYRVDLRNPGSFFVMQRFAIADKDLLYVSNAPAAELQKFLNLVFSIAYPVINTINLTQ